MPFRPCPSGCDCSLSADDGHDRCLQCLGFQHAEDAFVDDSCACCGRMSMISLRSRLSFMKGLAPSAATRRSGRSEGYCKSLSHRPLTPHAANIPSGSRVISLVCPTGRPAFNSVRHLLIGCRSQHRGMGSHPLGMKVRWGCPPRVLSPPPHRTQS